MTRLIFLDTETTSVDPKKARLVELGVKLIEVSRNFEDVETLQEHEVLIRPNTIDQFPSIEATSVHGITGDEMLDKGIELETALELLGAVIKEARRSPFIPRLIIHNAHYDISVLAHEYSRVDANAYPINFTTPFCTMLAMAEHCRLPGKYGKYKWPKLQEAWRYCFPQGEWDKLPGKPHRAMFDVERCQEIYLHGLQQKWWSHD